MVLYSDNQFFDALLLAGLALIVNLPVTYKFTQGLLGSKVPIVNLRGCPTWQGVAIHAAVLLVVYLLVIRSLKKKLQDVRDSVVVLNPPGQQ